MVARCRRRVLGSSPKRRTLHAGSVLGGVVDTEDEARALRDAIRRQIADGETVPITGATISDLTPTFLASRSKNRASKDDEGRWYRHVRDSKLARLPVAAIEASYGRADRKVLQFPLRATEDSNLDLPLRSRRFQRKRAAIFIS